MVRDGPSAILPEAYCPRFGAAEDSQNPWCLTNRQGPSNELGRPDYGGRLTGTVISVDRGVRVGQPSCTGRSTESLRSVDRVVEVGRPTWVFQLTEKNLSSCARVLPVNFKNRNSLGTFFVFLRLGGFLIHLRFT